MANATSFAELLVRHRLAAGLSQEALADRAQMSANAIGALERGKRRAPYRRTIALLAEALNLSAVDRAELEMASDRARGRQSATKKQAPADNLPVKLSSFINRNSEVAEIKSLLREHRLVTLTGSGGVGKTRCAIQVASQLLAEGLQEVRFVDLSPIRDDNFVASTIATVVEAPSAPVRDPLPSLPARLRHRSLLLVLDNCEHVIDGIASAAAVILQGCPGITILATSRERLAIDGERVYRLPALDATHALRLFSERATASDASFVLTSDGMRAGAEICSRLGGIPLAIELAATRAPTLGLETLNARLSEHVLFTGGRDLPERQRTTLATIVWSYQLLRPTEQTLLRRLAIFRGGASLETTEAVCATGELVDENIPELLSRLVDKSLVDVQPASTPAWFTMLDSVHAFALEKLKESKEANEVARAHARWLATVCERAAERFTKDFRDSFLVEFAPLLDDARAALEWATSSANEQDAVIGAQIAGRLRGVWLLTNRRAELRAWIEALLPSVNEDQYPDVAALMLLALIQCTEGAVMSSAIDRAVRLFKSIGFTHGMILVHTRLAWQANANANFAEADAAIAHAFALAEGNAGTMLYAHILDLRATIHIAEGRTREARIDLQERARRLAANFGLTDPREHAHKEAMIALIEGNARESAELLERAIEYHVEHSRSPLEPLIDLVSVRLQLGDLVGAESAAHQALELVRLEGSDLACWALQQMATIAVSRGEPIVAARLFGFVDGANARPGREDAAFGLASRKHLTASLRNELSLSVIEHYRQEGAALSIGQAISMAQGIWQGDTVRVQ